MSKQPKKLTLEERIAASYALKVAAARAFASRHLFTRDEDGYQRSVERTRRLIKAARFITA